MRQFFVLFCKNGTNHSLNKFVQFVRFPNFSKRLYRSKTNPQNSFLKAIDNNMLSINIITSGILMLAGDIVNQEIEFYRLLHCPAENCRYNWKRAGCMFAVGLMLGPPQHYFYKVLDKRFPQIDMLTITKKILIDQLILSPTSIIIFFYGLGLVEQTELSKVNKEFKQKFWTVYKMDWTVWPGVQYLNFYYVSPKYRVIYVNVITMLYDIFLSYIKYEPQPAGAGQAQNDK